jgi:glucose-6-phosphate isomerase
MEAVDNRPAGQSVTERPAWKALQAHYKKIRGLHLRKLFAKDAGRGERLTAEALGISTRSTSPRIAPSCT